jgi:predicted phosphodiesterase
VLGKDYKWYPVIGNHEQETPEDMEWLREWGAKNAGQFVNTGPENAEETFYSFDYKNAHFIAINQYYDGESDIAADGDVTDPAFEWLENDLKQTDKQFIFVIGHEPIISIMDYHSGRLRHKGDNLDKYPENASRFMELLRKYNVSAYLCGHTHNFSYAKINGVWQLDAGHSRGIGDTGSPSTFLKIFVSNSDVWFEVYRDDADGGEYRLMNSIHID